MNKETNWQDVGYIISSNYRRKILENLKLPKTPSKLSKELNINITHISRALTELESKKMIKCLNPELNKGKLYIITEYGKNILKKTLIV